MARRNLADSSTPRLVTDEDAEGSGRKVEVLVLGPVSVAGAARSFARSRSLDLVVYLALNRRVVLTDQWAAALWPQRLVAASTLHATASDARRALGRSPEGHDHLPRRRLGLALADSVTTDWERFVGLVNQGTPAAWRRALDLVRGRPFEGLRQLDWTVLEGHVATIEATVATTAERLGTAELAAGHGAGAAAAARVGLKACPFDERLHRLLLRAADAQGNRGLLERVMADLVTLFGEGELRPRRLRGGVAQEAEGIVHPSTFELYEALRDHPGHRRRLRAAAGPARLSG